MNDDVNKSDLLSSTHHQPIKVKFSDFNETSWQLILHATPWHPPTDVYETDEALIVRVEVAGMHENDFSIEINGHSLLIRGVRKDASRPKSFHQMEIRFGEFMIELELPIPIDTSSIEAIYNNGFLHLILPKAKPFKVHIDV
jgi:HSP20 family protein